MHRSDLDWLAGLLEGEGCFIGGPRHQIGIRLAMTDRDVVERAGRLMGREAKTQKANGRRGMRKDAYVLHVTGSSAAAWMMTLWPLMGDRRRRKITEALRDWNARPVAHKKATRCKHGHKYTSDNTIRVERANGSTVRLCRECRSLRSAACARKQGRVRKERPYFKRGQATHCQRGHEFTEENTMRQRGGHRLCRACHNERNRAARERRKLAAA